MPKILNQGKVVVILNGRYAGKKAVVVRTNEKGTSARPYPHCLVAGIEKAPEAITRAMPRKKAARKNRIKPFVKEINLTHVLPTRYNVDFDLQSISGAKLDDPTARSKAKNTARNVFQYRHRGGKNKWFFSKLRF
eukprot:TRINITY_DN12060_c0_g1_i1.p1 TRINITY_DN12060_c0_g1~~TRINITY_DN12060_c0_g1_i1.p1  ORF type:complete len:135 (+),score=28.23 TRINITY_DN12060_c0_g1_i1:71-475(+)